MRKYLLLCSAVVIACLSSCTTVRKTASTATVDARVCQYPTVADLDVKGKIEKTVEWNFVPCNFGQPPLEVRKQNTIAEIVRENGADVLLEPQVSFTKVSFGKRTLVITGYPAAFKSFRKATAADLEALRAVTPGCEASSGVRRVSQPWYRRVLRRR